MKIRDAKVCLDCDEVFPIHLETCPKCGSPAFAWLAGWVKPIKTAGPGVKWILDHATEVQDHAEPY